MAKRKPWRKFKENRQRDKRIRQVCLAVLGAELAVLQWQGRLSLPVIRITEGREFIIYQMSLVEGEVIPAKDDVCGVRIRLKDGVVDFYRREEIREGSCFQGP